MNNGITFVQLLSPTTSVQRMKQIIKDSHNMIYYISQSSTTGGKLKVTPKDILKNYNKIKRNTFILTFFITILLPSCTNVTYDWPGIKPKSSSTHFGR